MKKIVTNATAFVASAINHVVCAPDLVAYASDFVAITADLVENATVFEAHFIDFVAHESLPLFMQTHLKCKSIYYDLTKR